MSSDLAPFGPPATNPVAVEPSWPSLAFDQMDTEKKPKLKWFWNFWFNAKFLVNVVQVNPARFRPVSPLLLLLRRSRSQHHLNLARQQNGE